MRKRWKVRDFDPGYLAAACSIFARVFSAPPWNEPWDMEQALYRIAGVLEQPGGRGWHVAEDLLLFGFAFGHEAIRSDGEAVFQLCEMAVRRDLQCRGIGTAMLRAVEHDVERAGLSGVEILTVDGKYPCHFYERNGYAVAQDLGDGQVLLARAPRG